MANPEAAADETLAASLRAVERRFRLDGRAAAEFQGILAGLGVASSRPIALPVDDTPFWLRHETQLTGHGSAAALPATADVVVVGAGLTGASVAYHLADAVSERGLRVVVLDKGDPGGEASGRNGGNFELLPENSVGVYEGLATERTRFLERRHPRLPREVLLAEGERQASLVLGLALRNRDRLVGIVRKEGIDCDFSPRGWLYLAHTHAEEQAICDEVTLAARHGQRIEIWSRSKIRKEFGFETEFLGRFIPGDGTYHPFKFLSRLLEMAIDRGVSLYARTRVDAVEPKRDGRQRVRTPRGDILARSVVIATNAFTAALLPELGAIEVRQSQVMVTELAPDFARGRIVTSERGPVFFNQPREGARNGRAPLLFGGGDDRPLDDPDSRRRSRVVHELLLRQRDLYYPALSGRPPSTEWIGPMAFTPDQLPAIGVLRPGVIVAAGFNGYGGSYCTAAGMAAAEMVLTGHSPSWLPEDVFSPTRFASEEPRFLAEREGLWRIAASLCQQLKAVNQRLRDAYSFSAERAAEGALDRHPEQASPALSACVVAPDEISGFPLFASFTPEELAELLARGRSYEAPAGTYLFHEGDPGGTCFIVVRGAVDVTAFIRGRDTRIASLPAGSLFGEVSVVGDEPRTATCVVAKPAVLVELGREECRAILDAQTTLSLKFLGAINAGLIADLRDVSQRLMHLDAEGRIRWDV